MAVVYAARDRRLERRVAVKVVPAAATEADARHRFVREARSAAGLCHPNAVAVFDAGEADGHLFLVMEFVDGRTLADLIVERGPFEAAEATAVASAVLAALGHAHAAGIVHRDVKPSNIMLSDDGTVKLLDFGIARRFDDLAAAVTADGEMVGTPRYLAPEQIEGGAAVRPPTCTRWVSSCSRCSPAAHRSTVTHPSPPPSPAFTPRRRTFAPDVTTFQPISPP